MSDDAPSTEVDDTPSFSVKGKWAPNASTAVSEESSEPASKSFSVAGRWNPSAGKASDALAPKPAVERSAAVAALSSSKTTAAAKVESPAEAYAAALSKIVVAINGAEYPLSELQAAKKGKEGPLSDIDFELKHSYLTEADFNTVFGMPFDEFDKLPAWKQKALRQKANLY